MSVVRYKLPCNCSPGETCAKCQAFRAERKAQRQLAAQQRKAEEDREKKANRPAHHRAQADTPKSPAQPQQVASNTPHKGLPGSEATALLASLGLAHRDDCSCAALADWMDRVGVAGCRASFDYIVKRMRKNREKYGTWDIMKAAAKAVANGLAFTIDWTDPIPGLLNEAIRRAEEASKSVG